MRRAERIEIALAALGEAGEAAALAQRANAGASTGQNLVRIGLMADVPDQPVARRLENVVQRDGQLDDASPAPRWPPVTETAASSPGATRLPAGATGLSSSLPQIARRFD